VVQQRRHLVLLAEAPTGTASAKAILVSSTRTLASVLGATTIYVRPDGTRVGTGAEIIQAMGSFLGPASIESPVSQDGAGNYVDEGVVQLLWTGVGGAPANTCRDWTSGAAADSGSTGAVAAGWEYTGNDGSFACNNTFLGMPIVYLQCAEQ
jgi:hypothetical protein